MTAHLFLMKNPYAAIGPNPIKTIEINSMVYSTIIEQLTPEFEIMLKGIDAIQEPSFEAVLSVLYENDKDRDSYTIIYTDSGRTITTKGYHSLIPALRYKDNKIIPYE